MGEGFMGDIKKPTTFKEQVQILRSRGLVIDDENAAISMLQNINYYRLSAYLLTYKARDGSYRGVSITDAYNLYQFDKQLRNLILPMLEDIEIAFRTHIAYLIAHKYGALGYKDSQNFRNVDYHTDMLIDLENEINRSDEVFVGHHKRNYGGVFPIWVVIELTTFGVLSKMYSNLLDEDKDEIARKYYNTKGEFVRTWLHSLSTLRNICAHYGRLYNKKLAITPKLYRKAGRIGIKNDTVFANIYIIGRLLKKRDAWEHFVTRLAALIEQYKIVELKCLGFPGDWETILRGL
ncbi:MAG: Abi family protein [Firmicutes bacterium]|nr:Abi family protein [Bacillota bacterium]